MWFNNSDKELDLSQVLTTDRAFNFACTTVGRDEEWWLVECWFLPCNINSMNTKQTEER